MNAPLRQSIEIFDQIEQGTPEWFSIRRGLPTASNFACLMANSADKKGRASYLRRLAAEIITGEVGEDFTTPAMQRGKDMEDEARRDYAFVCDMEPRRVGFIRNNDIGAGCSPDALLGDDGVLEIKTQRPDLLIDTLFKKEFPPEHIPQCQGSLLVSGREWCEIFVCYRKMPRLIKRAHRDEPYLDELQNRIQEFNYDLTVLVERIQGMWV